MIIVSTMLTSCLSMREKRIYNELDNTGEELSLKILTFNILSSVDLTAASQGYPAWVNRKQTVFEMITQSHAELLSIQECSVDQLDELEAKLRGHYELVDHRSFSSDAVLFYQKNKFELIEKGYYTIERPWEMKISRIAVWVMLREKKSGRQLVFISTHLDAKDIKNQEVERIYDYFKKFKASGAPVFFAGDFNIDPDEESYGKLIGQGWVDTHMGPLKSHLTYPFKAPIRRIDHIFYWGRDVNVKNWQILEGKKNIAFSDHKPVLVEVYIEAASTP